VTQKSNSRGDIGADQQRLERGIGLGGATALAMTDMIGVGPFITIPLIVAAAGGPQAMLGWIAGAVLALCDGLVWAELGAAMPRAGGSYHYLGQIYGPQRLGRLVSFLFIWQLTFSAPLSIASGCIGLADHLAYIFPSLENHAWGSLALPLHGRLQVSGATLVAVLTCALAVLLLYRRISRVSRISQAMLVGVIATIAWVIFAGVTHFRAALAFDFPPHAFALGRPFVLGMGAALLVATYDFWGYYNVCFLGEEVREPERNIPRAMVLSIVLVAAFYLVMNTSILGVMPWRELVARAGGELRLHVVPDMMQQLYGRAAGVIASLLIAWTAFASVFALLAGYSRIPYAAAQDGNYFRPFGKLHAKGHFPHVSLLALGGVAALFCFLRLSEVIGALVVIRILMQFLLQALGVIVLRVRRPDMPRPFRMWLYPLPALVAIAGFLYVAFGRPDFQREVRYAAVLFVAGVAIYMARAWPRREWPFGKSEVRS
jgi:APA family basic amino acid/polyamine antiporter